MSRKSHIRYVLVTNDDDGQRAGFIAVYKEAFGGPPYNETYTDDQVVEEAWNPHREHGIIVLALKDNEIVGFGCCLPMCRAPEEIQDYLRIQKNAGAQIPDLADTWYMSDVGVLNSHRGQGIGTQLIGRRLSQIIERGNNHYAMRTAAEGSNSRRIYESIGSVLVPGFQDVSSSDQVQVNQSQSKKRVYLHGQCARGMERIFTNELIKR